MATTAVSAPVADAFDHLTRLVAGLDPTGIGHLADGTGTGVDLDALARARPEWPPWPTPSLAMLVGPPAVVPRRLDLTWLHRFDASCRLLDAIVAGLGGPMGGPSALSLLVERAALLRHRTWGTTSAGTSCRLLPGADRWVAINLPRPDDIDAVPALAGLLGAEIAVGGDDAGGAGVWDALAPIIAATPAADVLAAARVLGLAVAVAPHLRSSTSEAPTTPGAPAVPSALVVTPGSAASQATPSRPLRVVDLSSLWAGPLCGWYLVRAGADVVKVESSTRPDGARAGSPAFWRRLNGDKTLVELDLAATGGVEQLRRLLAAADVVIEASRPRAMAGFGIDPAEVIARGGIWCSISGHGRTDGDRIAFGDDAAVAGGLVADTGDEPWFIGDAAADPIAGVTAALGVASLWAAGRGGFVDVAMSSAVAALTGGGPVTCVP
ncbi:MAG: CoA transferase [Acidimicrobiales bacterium]